MKVALLFAPQGSQHVGMGQDLADRWSAAADVYRSADEALGWNVSGTCWEGPEERLNDTRQTQPCLVTTSLAALAALRQEIDPRPSMVAGHSVGEYAALVAAGVLEQDDALRLVRRRGELMAQAAPAGGMSAVIGLSRAAVAEVVASVGAPERLVVANDNAPGQVVISGTHEALEAAREPLRAAGAKRVLPLKVSGPFHSPLMAGAGEALAAEFDRVTWHDARLPLVSNVTGEPVQAANLIRGLLARQVSSPVEWVRSVQGMERAGVDTFVEIGPGMALSGMVRRIAPDASILNVADENSLRATVRALAPVPEAAGRP